MRMFNELRPILVCPLDSSELLPLELDSMENTYDPGFYWRKSVRLQSWDAFNHGVRGKLHSPSQANMRRMAPPSGLLAGYG